MDSSDLETYQRDLRKHLKTLAPIFANAAAGDFSQDVKLPAKDNELSVFFAGVEVMLEAIREKERESKEILEKLYNVNAELQHEKAVYQAILSSIAEGLVVVDKEAHITLMNQAAADMLGVDGQAVIGRNYYDIVITKDREDKILPVEKRALKRALTTGRKQIRTMTDELQYVHSNGTTIPVTITASPVKLNNQIIAGVSTFQDISTEKQLDRTKSEIISIASHQLRTPLTAIKWLSEQLIKPVHKMSRATQKLYLQRIHASNERMITLVNDLLNVSRIELGTISLSAQPFDLPRTINDVLNELDSQIKLKHIKVQKQIGSGLDAIVTDRRHVQVILQNLLANAVKYSPKNHTVTVSARKDGQNLRFEIRDTGYGIPENQQSKIFNKLFRADNARKQVSDGTGLGLYVGKAMVDQLGGKIWFESAENKGTTFFVILPLTKPNSR